VSLFYRICVPNQNKAIPAATDTLSERFTPGMGISAIASQAVQNSDDKPSTSFPTRRTIFPFFLFTSKSDFASLFVSNAQINHPCICNSRMSSNVFSRCSHGTRCSDPNATLAISFRGGVPVIPVKYIFSTPNVSEDRNKDPTLCRERIS